MKKEDSLSEKIVEAEPKEESILFFGDVKSKIQNAQKRLKEEVERSQYDYANLEHVMKNKVMEIIDKIFLEEFGDKLIK